MFNTPKNTDRIYLPEPVNINILYDDISKKYIPQGKPQTIAFAKSVRAENHTKTVRKIWEYCRKNFVYKFDGYPDSKEIIRLPNASVADKAIDCEDFTIFIGSTLCNLGIPFIVRMAAYSHTKTCHLYIVALINGRKVIVDPCNPVFNNEDKGEFWDTYFDEKGNRIKSIHALGQSRSIGKMEDIKDYVRGNPNVMFGTLAPTQEKKQLKWEYFESKHQDYDTVVTEFIVEIKKYFPESFVDDKWDEKANFRRVVLNEKLRNSYYFPLYKDRRLFYDEKTNTDNRFTFVMIIRKMFRDDLAPKFTGYSPNTPYILENYGKYFDKKHYDLVKKNYDTWGDLQNEKVAKFKSGDFVQDDGLQYKVIDDFGIFDEGKENIYRVEGANSLYYELKQSILKKSSKAKFQEEKNKPAFDIPAITQSTPMKKDKDGFVKAMMQSLRDNKKENKVSSQNLAKTFGITVQMEVKELTELAIVYVARELAHQIGKTPAEKYDDIVKLYQNQVRLNHRSSESIIFQQYSTPAPIGYMMGIFCGIDQKGGNYLEPSAGNGLLTIAGNEEDFIVNEVSELRRDNLLNTSPLYKRVYSFNASNVHYPEEFSLYRKIDAVITNPPFGQLPHKVDFGKGESQINVNKLDHLMALLALECMKDDGKCAIILGGHTSYDKEGRISARTSGGSQAAGDRYFFNYLYHNFNVKDVILVDGDLYARQGTSFDIRVVLIDGRKQTPSGFAPLKDNTNTDVVKNFDELYSRFESSMPVINVNYPKFLQPIVKKPIMPIEDKTIVEKYITKHKIGDTVLDTKTNTQAVIKKISRPKEKTPHYGIESQEIDIVRENGKKAMNMPGSQFVKMEEKPQVEQNIVLPNTNEVMGVNIVNAKGADIRILEKGSVFEITKDDLLKYNQIKSKSPEEINNYFYSLPSMFKTMPQNYDTNKYYVDVSIAKASYDYYKDRPAKGFSNFFHLFTVTKEGTVNVVLKQHHDGLNEFMIKVTEYFNQKPIKTNDLTMLILRAKALKLKALALEIDI